MKHLIKHIVIVGGRAAGPAAAAKARRENPDAKITMLEAGRYISTGTCEMPYLVSGEISSSEELLFFTAEEFKAHYNVEVLLETKAVNLFPRKKLLQLDKNGVEYEMEYDRLVLATGALNNYHPQVPPEFENVFYIRNIEDTEHLLSKGDLTNRRWLVVGAAYTGLEFAEALRRKGNDVILLDKEKLPASGFDPEIRELIKEALNRNGVEFVGGVSDLKVFSEGNRVRKIQYEGRLRDIDGVIVSIGIRPDSRLAQKAGLELGRKGGIKVDSKMRTSDPYIFAAGDCVELKDRLLGRHVYLPQATLARDGGHVAGANAAGGNEFMYPVVRNSAIRIFDNFAAKIGMCSSSLED